MRYAAVGLRRNDLCDGRELGLVSKGLSSSASRGWGMGVVLRDWEVGVVSS